MIKFFRKIRQKMLTENKFSKYLLYAIGEIILVVIGILIALQLNILNEDRKIDTTVKVYYKQILQDFEKDKNYIKKMTFHLDSNMVKLNNYKKTFKESGLSINQIYANMNLDWDALLIQFQSNTISSLENTGDINLIPPHIRLKLISLKRFQDLTSYNATLNNESFRNKITYASRFYGSAEFRNRATNQSKILEYILEENRQIEILLALEAAQQSKELSERQSLMSFSEIELNIDELTKLINKELKK